MYFSDPINVINTFLYKSHKLYLSLKSYEKWYFYTSSPTIHIHLSFLSCLVVVVTRMVRLKRPHVLMGKQRRDTTRYKTFSISSQKLVIDYFVVP